MEADILFVVISGRAVMSRPHPVTEMKFMQVCKRGTDGREKEGRKEEHEWNVSHSSACVGQSVCACARMRSS